jgi:hypothetical protein
VAARLGEAGVQQVPHPAPCVTRGQGGWAWASRGTVASQQQRNNSSISRLLC